MKELILGAISAALIWTVAQAEELKGPARFCGYSPIIDLLPGERIITLGGGIHGGSFRWEGAFGSLDVRGSGWAKRPTGRIVEAQTGTKPARFAQRRADHHYEIAIWNGSTGVASFRSKTPLTTLQMRAISRVGLFDEGQDPPDCDLRARFFLD